MGIELVTCQGKDYNIIEAINKKILSEEDFNNLNEKNYAVQGFFSTEPSLYTWLGYPSNDTNLHENVFRAVSVTTGEPYVDNTQSPLGLNNSSSIITQSNDTELTKYEIKNLDVNIIGREQYKGNYALDKKFYHVSTGKFYFFQSIPGRIGLCTNAYEGKTIKSVKQIINENKTETLNAISALFTTNTCYLLKSKAGSEDDTGDDDGTKKPDDTLTAPPNQALKNTGANVYFNNTRQYSSYGDKFQCYLTIKHADTVVAVMGLPVYPQEFSDNNTGSFTPTNILGRSVAYQTYNSSSRTVGISLDLHEEIVNSRYKDLGVGQDSGYDYIHLLVSTIESACYPGYSTTGFVNPPSVALQIGRHFYVEGILTSASTTWKAPIIDGRLTNCTVNMSITEVSGPFSGNEISKFRGYRK